MAKPEQDLIVEPQPLVFDGPFGDPQTVTLKLTNNEDKRVAFKVKCTSNELFKIRTPVHFLEPNGTKEVSITLTGPPDVSLAFLSLVITS